MSKKTHTNPLSKREIERLRSNPYVASVTANTVRFTEDFKALAYGEKLKGISVAETMRRCGIDPDVLGMQRALAEMCLNLRRILSKTSIKRELCRRFFKSKYISPYYFKKCGCRFLFFRYNIRILLKDKREKPMSKKDLVAVSLFSGAGGLDIASFQAGVPVVSSTDFDSDCIETLKANELFGKTQIIKGDLHEIDSSVFKNALKTSQADKFIVIGGAPCQPFSKAGYWVGHQSRRGINDPRATLVSEYLRVVTDIHPNGFVFENVESLLHPTNRSIVDRFVEIISEQGYKYKIIRANALDYGVSQKRHRLFIIGTQGIFCEEEPRKTHCPPEQCEKTKLKPYVNVGPVIAGYDSEEFFEPEEVVKGGTYYNDLCEVPPGMNYKALTAWYGYPNPKFVAEKRYWSFLLKLSPDMPSWTITAQPGPWIGPFHWNNRRLRIPELAAIQAFPKGYKFFGSHRSIQKQIGNAVPSLMGQAMIQFLKESLE